MATFSVDTVFKAIDKMSAPMRRMERSVGGLQSRVQVAEAKVARGFRRITRAVGTLGIALGATALIGVAGDAISVFKDFEQANANLAAVMNISVSETAKMQKNAKQLGATTAFTASQVTELQTELAKLGFTENEILNMTSSTLSLAAATGTELSQAATQVGAAIRAFGMDSSEASRVADVFAASTSKSALDMEKLNVAMSTVAPVAKQFNFSIEDSTALLGKLVDAGFDASTAATSTRNIILNLADSNGKLAKALGRPVNGMDDMVAGMIELRERGVNLAEMLDLTDKRSVAAFATFLEGAEGIKGLRDALNVAGGSAEEMAKTQLNTLSGSLTILRSSYEGFILSMEDGNGTFSKTLRTLVNIASEMLSLASGSATAESELSAQEKTIRKYASIANTTLKILGYLTAAYVTYKVVMFAVTAVQTAYNTIQAVSLALQGKTMLFLKGNTAAMVAYKVITATVTAATWLWTTAQTAINAVIMANPIGALIAAIAILIGFIVLAVKNFDSFGSILLFLLGPIGMLVNAFMIMKKNWQSITDAFKGEGIIAGLKRIGIVLLDTLLYPLQQALELASNIPGLGDLASRGAERIVELRERLDLVNPEAERESARDQRQAARDNANVDVTVRDETGRAQVRSRGIEPKLEPTFQ